MDPDLLAKELLDHLWETNTGKLFVYINQNGYLVTSSGTKWSVNLVDTYDNKLVECADKWFLYCAQKEVRANIKRTDSCVPIFSSSKIISYDVGIDFNFANKSEYGSASQEVLSLIFTHIPPTKEASYRLRC